MLLVPPKIAMRRTPCRGLGGAGLVGRTYYLAGSLVLITGAYGPGAHVRNVAVRFPDGSTVIRPFRGLRTAPPSHP